MGASRAGHGIAGMVREGGDADRNMLLDEDDRRAAEVTKQWAILSARIT